MRNFEQDPGEKVAETGSVLNCVHDMIRRCIHHVEGAPCRLDEMRVLSRLVEQNSKVSRSAPTIETRTVMRIRAEGAAFIKSAITEASTGKVSFQRYRIEVTAKFHLFKIARGTWQFYNQPNTFTYRGDRYKIETDGDWLLPEITLHPLPSN